MGIGRQLLRLYTSVYEGASGYLARKLKHNFYLYLAGLFTLFILLDGFALHRILEMRHRAYDLVIRSRIVRPSPDPDIVIVDVNEASLAAMATDYGRWPWPRQVFGEFLEHLERQRPRAVVFDILFSDPDVFNPDSDAYFGQAVAATDNTFFPLLRLPPESDRLSEVRPGAIPGVTPIAGVAQPDRTVAVVLPYFRAMLESGRLGTHNIYPDRDGIARSYRLYHDVYGWKLPSLPLRVGQVLGWTVTDRQDILLNWRGKPFTYRYVTFSDVYLDMLSKERRRPPDEFRGKIVLIGSTAPSLFDIKPTSMDRQFPGVEILATAIDNLRHDDYIRVPGTQAPVLLAALVILWGTAWGFYRKVEPERFPRIFGLSQIALLGISYLTINLTRLYFNLAGPVTFGVVFFSIAKIYALATARALERNPVVESLRERGKMVGTMAVFLVRGRDEFTTGLFMRALDKAVRRLGGPPRDVGMVHGKQRGLWGLFENSLVVSWTHARDDRAEAARVEQDVQALRAALPALIERHRIGGEELEAWALHRMPLGDNGTPTPDEWRRLFAETLRRLEPAPDATGGAQAHETDNR
jgi:CHASE2 domain-containing sensor protein